jgi:hypothetical protein
VGLALVMSAVALSVVVAPVACTPGQREGANSALDVVKVACIVAHQTMPDSKVAEICGIAQPFIAPMQDILASARKETAQAVAASHAGAGACAPCNATCGGDAGASK